MANKHTILEWFFIHTVVPLVPVLIPLVVDLSLGNDPSNDIIIRRSGDEESTLTL